MDENDKDDLLKNSNDDNSSSLKITFKEGYFEFKYKEYKIKIKISNDNNYIKIIFIPKIYDSELYEYTITINEFKKLFNEYIKNQKSPEDYGQIIKQLLINKKILINYDKNLYNFSFYIILNNNTELIFDKNINVSKNIFKNNNNILFYY